MSIIKVRAALETAVSGMASLAPAWENVPYTPVPGTPYQKINLLPARPDNRENGPNYTEQGILQFSLMYPLEAGSSAAMTRAELIRSTFYRGRSFTSGGVITLITDTPEIGPAMVDGDRFMVPVRVRWRAQVTVQSA